MRILTIDDQLLITFSVHRKLTNQGYTVETAANGLEGIKKFEQFEPDMVIVDYQMPIMNGVAVIEYIRNTKKSGIPILILSGSRDETVKTAGFEMGISDYLAKPVDLDDLVIRVEELFIRARMAV